MKLYVAGPMRGYADHNWPAFFSAKKRLEWWGHVPILPIEDDDLESRHEYPDFMRRDIRWLSECDGIVLLRGWEDSTGATFEARCALEFNMPAFVMMPNGPSWDSYELERIDLEHLRGTV